MIKAHIIPEFFYKELYDDAHGYIEFNTKNKKDTRRRKGTYDSGILCDECDRNFLGKRFDDYGSKVLWGYRNMDLGIEDFKSREDENVKWRVAKKVDGGKIKLFLLSILWRAHVSSKDFFGEVNLGRVHSEGIRRLLINQDAGGRYDYPIILMLYSVNDGNSRRFISKIKRFKRNGKYYYASILAGMFVIWYISDNLVPIAFRDHVVCNENKLSMIFSFKTDYEFIAHFTGEQAFKDLGRMI